MQDKWKLHRMVFGAFVGPMQRDKDFKDCVPFAVRLQLRGNVWAAYAFA